MRGERPDTIAQVLAARTLVARWRGDRDALLEAQRLVEAQQLGEAQRLVEAQRPARDPAAPAAAIAVRGGDAAAPVSPIPVRAGDAAIAHYRRSMRRALVLAAVAAAMTIVHLVAIVPALLAIGAAGGAREAARRLERQRVAARFLRPCTKPIHEYVDGTARARGVAGLAEARGLHQARA